MRVFTYLYDYTLNLSSRPQATRWLALISFSEAIFFPVPVDVLLAPMVLVNPKQAKNLALVATVWSVVGGVIGYILGSFLLDILFPVIQQLGYISSYEKALQWFQQYGIWVIIVAGFTPIPFKIFTIASGSLGLAFLPFIFAAVLGRGMRFYLVAWLVAWKGNEVMLKLYRHIDTISYSFILLFLAYLIIS